MTDEQALDHGLPLVGEDQGNRGLWVGLSTIGVAGIFIFAALNANRRSGDEVQIAPPRDYARASAQGPELIIPEPPMPVEQFAAPFAPPSELLSPVQQRPQPVRLIQVRPSNEPNFSSPVQPPQTYALRPPFQPQAPDPGRAAPVIVFDAASAPSVSTDATGAAPAKATRATANRTGDRTHLVPQGTLIFAVLETALDSTQSGQVRAMISTDVTNTQGTKVLIPKGSRIFGDYKGELGAGQNRAQVIWSRLIHPDGVTIALDSPASDQLGRAGVKGRVNTYFGTRLLGALLQSSIDFGMIAASRAITDGNGVIIALPNAVQSATSQLIPPPPKPTLKVRHGTRIAVFVSRDLDFSGVQ